MVKLQSQSNLILAALLIASKCITKKSTLAIFENVLLTRGGQDGDSFVFVGASSDSNIITAAPVSEVEGKMEKDICLPVSRLIPLLSSLPECVVTLTVNDDYTMDVDYCIELNKEKAKTGHAAMPWLDADYFARLNTGGMAIQTSVAIPASSFAEAVTMATAFAENDDLHPQMSGVCVRVQSDNELRIEATNGHKFVRSVLTREGLLLQGSPKDVILFKTHARFMPVIGGSGDVTITMYGKGEAASLVVLETENTTIICKNVEGKFPKTDAILPKDSSYIEVDRKELSDTLKRISLSSGSTKSVILEKDGLTMTLTGNDIDYNLNGTEQVMIYDSNCQDCTRVVLAVADFREICSIFKEDKIHVKITSPQQPVTVVRAEGEPDLIALMMPLRL